jgi:TPR repeat protein
MDDEIDTAKAGKIPAGYKALMAVIAVVTVLAVWLLPDNEQATPPPLPELPGTQKAAVDLPQLAGGSGEVIRDGDLARAFIASLRNGQNEFDPDAVFDEAERLQGEGRIVDAHLLYRFAARHGHGQAALMLGTQADPAFYTANSPDTLQDNPEQAYKWYSMAADAGIDEAVTRLQALRQNVELSASAGDERAQRLLLLWK